MFQLGVAVFIVGSFFCGLANSMVLLIAFRAVQGLGGGALTVTSTALIADVIPLRLRGQYQGALGAVFGVTTVIGPLLGGVFTDNLSWRWVFYINVPIAVIVIALAARTIPQVRSGRKPVIDYLGILFVALGATGLTLATSWGGTQYAWGSATIIGLFAASVAALAIFVWVELRAAEPILPMRLFRSRVFTVCSVLSFIVGFAMIGSITFMPTFLQYVNGVSATASGLRMLPMVIGLLATALASGTIVSRTGRYRPFPIAGSAVTAVGLYLLSRMDAATSVWVESLFLPQVAMRGVGAADGVGDGFAVPEGSDNEHQLANVVGQILRRDNRSSLTGIMAASGSALDVATAWGVIGVFVRQAAFGAPTREADIEARIGVPPGVLRPFYRDIVSAGYLTRSGDGVLELTERGQAEADKLVAAWKAWLMGELRDWLSAHEVTPAQAAEVEAALGRITLRLVREAEAEAGRAPVAAVAAAQAGAGAGGPAVGEA